MAATFSTKVTKVPASFFKRSGQLVGGAAAEYFESALPTSTSIIKESASTFTHVTKTLTNTSQNILPQLKGMKLQTGLRSVLAWFNGAGDTFGSSNFDADLTFDTETDFGEETKAQLSEIENVSNNISKAVIESDKHLLEGNMQLTANIVTSIDKQTAVISAGFDRINDTLGKILEVMTKNTATLIEMEKAGSASEKMMGSGKFNLNEYKKIIKENIQSNPSLNMISAFLPMFTDKSMMKMMITPESIVSMAFEGIINKKAPNLKKNLRALDEAVNETIMNSLIRLGEKKNNRILSMFGINSDRKDYSNNSRSTLEVKAVPFDTITKESITQTIPGYLRKILVQLGGEDVIYDNRSRSWRKGSSIKKDFIKETTDIGSLYSASNRIKESFGNEQLGSMIYDLMMTNLGHKQGTTDVNKNQSAARSQIDLFSDPKKFVEYVNKELYQAKNKDEERYIEAIAKRLSMDNHNLVDISNSVARNNIQRTKRVDSYLSSADKYGIDISKLSSSLADEMNYILEENGVVKSKVNVKSAPLFGVEYSNRALYEIYRILDRGINVFQTGSTNNRKKPYKRLKETYLKAPSTYKPNQLMTDESGGSPQLVSNGSTFADDTDNLLRNNTLEDGTEENLTKGERFRRWGKSKSSDLFKAMFSGSPEQVKEVFGSAISDLTGIMGDAFKKQAGKINDSFGNVTGYLKHKFFGTGYEYTDENGDRIKVKDNEKGGMLAFVKDYFKDRLKTAKKSASEWFNSVKGYFSNNDPDESNDIKKKRKFLITTSVGAFAGAGILGGPIGLIVGGLAGSALSSVDIGSKIKELLFGDGKDGKKKGLIRGAFDSVIDPIRYQIYKSLNTFKTVIKNKILGPIADLGTAIKDRMGNLMDKTFGRAFRFIGKIIMAPFKIKGIAKRIFAKVLGTGVRGAARAGGSVFEKSTSILSNLIAGNSTHTYIDENGEKQTMSTKDWIKQNRQKRKASYKDEIKYDDYKTWKSNEDRRREEWAAKFHEYLKEDVEIIRGVEENTSSTSDDVHEILRLGSEEGSIFTHDKGIHERLDRIIDSIHNLWMNDADKDGIIDVNESKYRIDGVTGSKISNDEETTEDRNKADAKNADEFANSALAAGATIITEGNITTQDKMTFNKLWKEVGKPGSNREVVGAMLNTLLNNQENDLITQEEEKKSWWELLFEKLKDIAPIALAIGAIAKLLSNLNLETITEIVGKIKDVLGNIVDAIGNGIKLIFGGGDDDPSTDDDGVTGGLNAIAGIVDAKFKNAWDLVNPFADVYHRDNDAAGNPIVNKAVTEDKQWLQFGMPLKNAVVNSSLYNNMMNTYNNLRAQGYTPSQISNNPEYQSAKKSYNKTKTNTASTEGKSSVTKTVGSGITRNVAKMGAAQIGARGIGWITGEIAGNIAEDITGSEETAAQVQEYANYTGTSLATTAIIRNEVKSVIKKKNSTLDNVVDWCKTQLKNFCDFLSKHFKTVKKLQGVMSKITSFIDNLFNKSVGKLTNEVATKIATAAAKIAGKQVTATGVAAATFGLSIAAGAFAGAVSGYCSTENLFNVPPDSADALMKSISTLLKALFNAMEWTPVLGVFVSVFNLFDDLIFKGILGTSLKQYLAEFLYELLGDKSNLDELQGKMSESKAEYEEKFGTTLNDSAWNDLVNNYGLFDTILHGKVKTNEDGTIDIDASFNEDGSRKEGGLIGFGQNVKKYISSGWSDYKTGVSDAWNEFKTGASNTWNDIKKSVSSGWNELKTGVSDTWNEFKTGVSDTWNEFKTGVFNSWNEFKTGASNTWNDIKKSVSSGWNEFKTGVSDIGKGISTTLNNVGTSISSAISYIKNNLIEFPTSTWKYIKGDSSEVEFNIDDSNPGQPILRAIAKVLTFFTSPAHAIGVLTSKIGNMFGTISIIGFDFARQVKSYIKGESNTISFGINKNSLLYNVLNPVSKIFQVILTPIRLITKFFDGIADVISEILNLDSDSDTEETTTTNNNGTSLWDKIKEFLNGKGGQTDEKSITIPPIQNGEIQMPSITSLLSSFGIGGPLSKEAVVTSDYGKRTYPYIGTHKGIDISPADGTGKADVQSNVIGTVSYVKNDVPNSDTAKLGSEGWAYEGTNSGGNMVWIDTPDGYRIKNMHLKSGSIPTNLRRGSIVTIGDKIGEVGSTGWSTGQHLHYQVEKDGVPINPMYGTGGFFDSINNLVTTGTSILNKLTGGIFSSSTSSTSTDDTSTFSTSSTSTVDATEMAAKVIQIALNEVGTKETGVNNVKYNTWFYGREVNGSSYTWCMAFVQWCFNEAGIPFDFKSASVSAVYNHYKSTKPSMIIKTSDTILPGDVMIQNHHTGIVVKDNGDGTVSTIEGNTTNSVAERTQKKSTILGFIRHQSLGDSTTISTSSSSTNTSNDANLINGETRLVPISGLGKSKTFMGWQMITSKTSKQYKLRSAAGQNFDSDGFGIINGRYVVAMKPYWGAVGDYVDVKLDNGTTIKGIIGDIKGNENAGVSFSKYAHGDTKANSSIVEFVVDKNTWYPPKTKGRTVIKYHPEFNSTVLSVGNRGNYWGSGGGSSTANVPFIYSKNRVGSGSSSIGNNKYSSKSVVKPVTRNDYEPGNYITATHYNTPFITTSYGTGGDNSSRTDLTSVVNLLTQVVSELMHISNNTYSSSNYLSSINDKDFVDSGLRDSIKAINKAKASQTSNKANSSSSSAKSVASIAAP
jgi:murein DD-endopeptidase MepM/ murein hydrolase activator NlpD